MAVPIPILIETTPPPLGWQGESILDIATLVAQCLSGSMEVSLITGQVGGAAPGADVGPWLNGDEWWVWVPGYGYQPSQQGCPIGTVAMWGQAGGAIPPRWLLCNGQALDIASYPRLYAVIGTNFGGESGAFFLPPSGRFYLNAQAFTPDPSMGLGSPTKLVGITGGSQEVTIPASGMPPLSIQVPFLNPEIIDDGTSFLNLQAGTGLSSNDYPVTDRYGVLVGSNQQPISVMPPYVGINFIIKYL
jgi:microcystin-dependent protein